MLPLRFILQHLLLCRLVFLYWAPGQDFGFAHAHTILPRCVYWFSWLPTNNFWSIASLSRLMLCGWLMSATINGLMLPTFSEPRTNHSIWVTVGSTGKQKHVCTGTHLSSDCLPLLHTLSLDLSPCLSGSLIQSLCPFFPPPSSTPLTSVSLALSE